MTTFMNTILFLKSKQKCQISYAITQDGRLKLYYYRYVMSLA